ncbi:MAG: hypothetical protein ACKV2U_33275 [Bryobacteraceae bacterium]
MADQAVVQQLRDGEHRYVRILDRAPVDADLDVVVSLATPENWGSPNDDFGWWDGKSNLGIFLQRRSEPGLLYKIEVENALHVEACSARVERATATDVVISCTPEKGPAGPNRKYVYDIRAKGLIKRVEYRPFAMQRVVVTAEKAMRVGSEPDRLVALEHLAGFEPAFRVLRGVDAERWMRIVPKPARFGPGNAFTLSVAEGNPPLVVERTGGTVKRFSLPQSTYDEFGAARPERVKNGYSRNAATMNEQIGPWQVAEGTLWFGKTFYDGEGMTGVGGFGYFDVENRRYRMFTPEEIRNWSITAMLVEPDAVWLGLAHHGEWGSGGGGVVRFDRATEKMERFKLREIVRGMARVGDHIVMATSFGAAVFDGNKLRRFLVDETTDGRLRAVEGIPGDRRAGNASGTQAQDARK